MEPALPNTSYLFHLISSLSCTFVFQKLVSLLFYGTFAADSSTFSVFLSQTKYRQSPTYDSSTQNFSALQWWDNDTCSVEAVLETLNFDLFLAQQHVVGYSANAGQAQQAAAPSQPHDHKSEYLIHLQPFCIHTTSLLSTFSVVFNKLNELFNILL